MAFVNVPKDLSRVKNKVAFSLTSRQLICFGAAAVVGVLNAQVNQARQRAKSVKADGKPQRNIKTPPGKQPGGVRSSLLARVFGSADAPKTAQQSIPYGEMFRDGVCRVNDRLYTKSIVFQDINYHLAQNDDKTQIFENYCDFLNYFDSSVSVQLSFINQFGNAEEFRQSVDIPDMGDDFDVIRREYGDMLRNQLAKGNNGLTKTKYITFGVEADNLKAAKLRIERVEADILNNFKTLGVAARSLTDPNDERRHHHIRPGGRVFSACAKARWAGRQAVADFHSIYQSYGHQRGLLGRRRPAHPQKRLHFEPL